MPTKQVLLGGQILHGEDRAGQWIVEKLTGWYEPPSSKGDGGPRENADGDYESPQFYSARMITIDGILFHRGRGEAVTAMESLSASASLTNQTLMITDFGITRTAQVKSLGVDYDPPTRNTIRFQIRLKATDPYKYGETRSFSGNIGTGFEVWQRGTKPAFPVVTISGSLPGGYEIQLGTRLVTITRAVTSGNPHTVDMRTGVLRVNGSVVRSGFDYAQLGAVDPGTPQTCFAGPLTTGSGTVRVNFNDTYV